MNTLQVLFTTVLNMSITASYVAIGVIFIRLLLKKVPKIFSYALWLAVLIRLVCPVSFTSALSLLNVIKPGTQQNSGALAYVPLNIGLMKTPSINVGFGGLNKVVNNSLPQAVQTASANPMQIAIFILSIVWIVGATLLVLYSIISYLKVINNVQTATLISGNIFETDRTFTPFVCGFIKPKIYMPTGISQNERPYILAHERVHIKRLDYLIKPFAFLILSVHWFNPLMWLSFFLMSKDMEMSCDESVLKNFGDGTKANYSHSLLALATGKRYLLSSSPLAFGESNVKARIKNVLNYKKPNFWVVLAALIATAALIVVFTANPKNNPLATTTVHSGYVAETLIANKTLYVGDNSKVVGLINSMPLPAGIVRDTVALQTSAPPYGITINYNLSDAADVVRQGVINGDVFYRNSILLFSLIDNVDVINCKISDSTGKFNGTSYNFTHTRKASEQLMSEDVRHFANSTNSLKTLIDRLNSMSFGINATAKVTIDYQIDKYLETIMSSPQNSSNPQDYINAHQNEYNAILALDAKALPYLFSQFEKGGQTGLNGQIMLRLCSHILGGEDISYASKGPQDWYDTYKKYIQNTVALNSLKFVQQLNPKGSLILSNSNR